MLENIKDRLIQIRLKRDEKEIKIGFLVTGIVILILLANVVYLNFILVKDKSVTSSNISVSQSSLPSSSPFPTALQTPASTSTATSQSNSPTIAVQNSIRDYFIPLGSGTNQTSDWADVPGAQATVDLTQYQNIKEVRFEASVSVPTANESVSVRIFNQTDRHPAWNSEVTMLGGSSAYLTSSSITYDTGSKLYQVQMKTQLQAPANLTQGRIHIILK